MRGRPSPFKMLVLASIAVAVACGGSDSPSSPSGGSVIVQGVVLGMSSGGADVAASAATRTAASGLTVTVEGAGITTTVSANGTFELEGVPGGTFTLVFTKDGVEIGRVTITAADGSEVKITVQVQTSAVVVVEIKIDDDDGTATNPTSCLINGGKVGSGIELEGDVSSGNDTAFTMMVNGERASGLVAVSASGASFKCNGGDKLSDTACRATVRNGAKVHVRGTLKSCTTGAAEVTASEVKVQKAAGGGN